MPRDAGDLIAAISNGDIRYSEAKSAAAATDVGDGVSSSISVQVTQLIHAMASFSPTSSASENEFVPQGSREPWLQMTTPELLHKAQGPASAHLN